MKFIHAADIHLDSAFAEKNLTKAEKMRSELRKSFSEMITYANKNGIDFVLLAGDLFDSDYVTVETESFLSEIFSAYPSINFIITPGNHDPYTSKSIYYGNSFSDNVYVFTSDKLDYFKFEEYNLNIYGYAFIDANMMTNPFRGYHVSEENCINILCAHGDLKNNQSVYCPITTEDITNTGFDYVAIGHIHNPEPITKDKNTCYGYSGCLQGRYFDECGVKGFKVVTIEKESGECKINVEHVQAGTHTYEKIEVNLSGIEDLAEAYHKIIEETEQYIKPSVSLKVIITGIVSSSLMLSEMRIREMIEDKVFSLEIENKLLPILGIQDQCDGNSLQNEFCKLMKEKLDGATSESEKEEIALALKYGLDALYGNL